MLNLLNRFRSRSQDLYLRITYYGQQSSSLPPEQIQAIMEWIGLSIFASGYRGRSHITWYNDTDSVGTARDFRRT